MSGRSGLLKFVLILLGCVVPTMGQQRISELTATTSPSTNSWIEVSDMNATPKSRKYLFTNLVTRAQIDDSSTFFWQLVGTNLTGHPTNIQNAQISVSAAIDRIKIANGTADHLVINNGSGTLSSEATLGATRFPALTGDVTTPGGSLTTTIAANSVALTTDTTGNYAAGDAEGGAATSGDSATSFFSTGTIESARLPSTVTEHEISITFDGGGSELVDNTAIPFPIKHAWTVTGYEIIADQSGSVAFDIWVEGDPYDGSNVLDNPPADADSVTASAAPSLTAQRGKFSTTLTGWDTAWAANSMGMVTIDSATTITRATLIIYYTK